ncbi:xylulokinase [Mycobacterium montefiorense]|uniref:xylulokinase n=2 Tax=Mycobacterium montefiorense TaxID=154654 RepID=UPI002232BD76|nr:FGGY-family carbohydrate kinase [Mycobacterium montefiorense]
MTHMARVHPDIYATARYMLLPKDYCVMQLTGAVVSDAISAVRLAGPGGYVDEFLELVPRSRELLPPLAGLEHIAGRVRAGMPCAGTPVVGGTMDAWAGMVGSGVVGHGDMMYQSGTSEIVGIISTEEKPTPGVVVFPPYQDIVLHAAPTQSGGAALLWLSEILGKSLDQLSALTAQCDRLEAVPLFLPHLQGERAPIWDTTSRGVFARINSQTGAPEMARSVAEGVAFSARWALEAVQSSSGQVVSQANITGGGAKSDIWCQIRADALGIVLERMRVPEAAALGAAMLAGVGIQMVGSLRDAAERFVRPERTFEPTTAYRGYYDEKFAHFTALYETLRPFNARY